MEEIINQIIANRNYHMLSDKQVEAIEQLLRENDSFKKSTLSSENMLSEGEEYDELEKLFFR